MRKLAFLSLTAAALLLSACGSSDENANAGVGGDGMGGAGGAYTGGAATPTMVQEFQTSVGDRIFYATDRTDLTAEARATLDRQAQFLMRYSAVSVVLEGHADERGTREYNLGLGERRAQTAKNYLIAKGVSGDRVQTISYGKERPAVSGDSSQSWAQNRRAVTVLQ